MKMKKTILSLVFVFGVLSAGAQTKLKPVYDEARDPIAQIDSALSVVRQSDTEKFVLCQVGGNWCPWCLLFADFAAKDADIAKAIDDNFVYLHVNYNPRKQRDAAQKAAVADLLSRLGRPERFGFPVFVVLNQRGEVLHIQDSGFLEEDKGYSKEKVLRFLKAWTPAALRVAE